MKRMLSLGCALTFCLLVGCSSNRREGVLATTINKLNDAASKVVRIRELVDNAVSNADKDNTRIDSFAEALAEAAALRNVGKELQEVKREAENIKESATPEESKQLTERFRQGLNDALSRLTAENKKLNDTLTKVAENDRYKDAVTELRNKIRESEGEFDALNRTRS